MSMKDYSLSHIFKGGNEARFMSVFYVVTFLKSFNWW